MSLHSLADTFAHEGYSAKVEIDNTRTGAFVPIGHADTPEGGHFPDKPYNDVPKAVDASKAIYDALIAAKPQLGITAPSQPWPIVAMRIRHVIAQSPGRSEPPWWMADQQLRFLEWQRIEERESALRVANWQDLIRRDFGTSVEFEQLPAGPWMAPFQSAVAEQDIFVAGLEGVK